VGCGDCICAKTAVHTRKLPLSGACEFFKPNFTDNKVSASQALGTIVEDMYAVLQLILKHLTNNV